VWASTATVEIISFVEQAPEHLGGSTSGRQVLRPFGEDGLVLVETDDDAAVRVAVPDSKSTGCIRRKKIFRVGERHSGDERP
jgi:hypothetical protein